MSDIYFFTDVDLLEEQTAEQGQEQAKGRAFGPVFGHEDTQYRVTSMHTAKADPNAYAVCDGWIFAQEIDANYISIVLKPFYSNNSYTSQIKYFIYKGIKKSSLIENGFVIESIGTNKKTQSLLEYLNTSYNNYYKVRYGINSGSKNKITESTIGIGLIHKDNEIKETTTLDSIFQRSDIHFFRVKSGLVLGNFDKNNIGFEVVVNDIGESINLSDIRDIETIIEHNPSENDNDIEARTKKEKILNYIDPCCFYSEFYALSEDLSYEQVKQLKTVVVASYNNLVQTSHLMTNNDLYAVLQKYATSDIVYLDIRNQYRHSLNYYKNYCQENEEYATIKIGLDGDVFQSMQYKDSFGWPIMRLNVSSFVRENKWKPSSIKIKLPICDNRKPYVGLENGYFGDDYPSVCECLKETSEDTGDIGYTLSIEFAIPKIDITTTIPYHIKIVYYKGIDSIQSDVSGLEPEANHYIDYLFNLNKLVNENGVIIPLKKNNTTQWVTGVENVFVDESAFRGTSYIAQSGIAKDRNIITFFALKNDNKFISGTSNRSFLSEIGDELPYWNEITLSKETIRLSNGGNKATFSSNCLPDSIFTTENSFDLYPDGRDLIQLQISVFELQSIQTAMSQLDSRYDRRLGLQKNILLDANGKEIFLYEVVVRGYTKNQSIIKKSMIPTNIFIYRTEETDNSRVFLTEGAIAFLPSRDLEGENRTNFWHSYVLRHTKSNIRSTPHTDNDSNIITTTKENQNYSILYKFKEVKDSTNSEYIWYRIEWIDGNETKQGWIRRNIEDDLYNRIFYPVATFSKFIRDLHVLMRELDEKFPDDTYNLRITRLRHMTKESGKISSLFDQVIDDSVSNPTYLDNIPETFNSDNISYDIQLFVDYMGVVFANGKVVDLHHLFVGLDVLNHYEYNKTFFYIITIITIENNVDAATWAGDIGSAVADYICSDKKENEAYYYEKRASDEDLLGDIYPHQIKRIVQIEQFKNNSFRNVQNSINVFNNKIKCENDKDAFKVFYTYIKKNISELRLSDESVYAYLSREICDFAKLWWKKNHNYFFLTTEAESEIKEISEKLAQKFEKWLKNQSL